ncbi:phosphohydrolase [Acetobacter estunensis]|uniref:phosphohydrolase n=1 Tax=Acetobacter estunensis TaxID=104097 RepID=UPI001C2DC8E9|nr:phosphohydrolase [Acetobacter estunensis]MBV1838772.1 phosphohydrolase [Acetobacter estunensis]
MTGFSSSESLSPEGWSRFPVAADLQVRVHPQSTLYSPEVEARVDAIWNAETTLRPQLFNGRIFCADRIAPHRIEGHWTDYRHALAQMREPSLFGDRPLRQLAVCGALRCADGFVLARRSPKALYLGGFWQSPPAGTVETRTNDDSVDLSAQLMAETFEELGLAPDVVKIGAPRLAAMHANTLILDIGIDLKTSLPFHLLKERWDAHGNREYDELILAKNEDLKMWSLRSEVLPTTRWLMQADMSPSY